MMNGTVIGPVVTPPESNATETKSFGTKIDSTNTQTYSRISQHCKPDAEDRAQHCGHEEQADTDSDRPDQQHIGNGRHLLREHLQIRLCDRDQNTDQQCNADDRKQIFCFRQLCADALAHRGHGHVRAKLEKSHPNDQQHRADQKQGDRFERHGRDRHAEQQDDRRDRQDGRQRLV